MYFQARRVREPVYYVSPSRIEIVSSEKASIAPLKIFREDGTPVTNDVSAVVYYFWNQGKEPIRPEDILAPVIVRLCSPNCRILDYKVVRRSREITEFNLSASTENPETELVMNFRILEEGDGAACQLIYEGDRDAELEIKGTIVGVRQILDLKEAESFYHSVKDHILAAIGVFVILLYVVMILPERTKGLLSEKTRRSIGTIGLLLMFALFVIGMVTKVLEGKSGIGKIPQNLIGAETKK